jgi:hypothetical protein
MKKIILFFLLFACAMSATFGQSNSGRHKIAIFAPLYLDSAYDAMDTYRYAKNEFPVFLSPGLEFYEGAQLALDSMRREGNELEVFVYDTRSASETLNEMLEKPEMDGVELIITHCNVNEVKTFADAGAKRNIPVINVNLPNDVGVKGNSNYVMLNSTLRTQCEGIYRHVQKYYATNALVVFRKKGQIEDLVKNFFEDYSKKTVGVPLKLKYVDLPDSFTVSQLTAHLDSNRQTLCIAGSLNDHFGKRLTAQLASIAKTYQVSVMGMPTWDGIKDFSKPEYRDIEITYGNPFYNSKMDRVSTSITNYFNTRMYARPSDMVFRGYEVTWKYAKLLLQYGKDFGANISNKSYKVFTDFDIQPVLNDDMSLDYFENKKVYFIKWENGVIKAVY